MSYTYSLQKDDLEIISYKSPLNKTDTLIDHIKYTEVNSGEFALVVHDHQEEILRLNGLSRQEGIALFDSLKIVEENSDSFILKSTQQLTKGKKIGIKFFVAIFMGFGVLSLLIRLKDYSRNGNGWNIFNMIITVVFIFLLCYGIWIYFFSKDKKKKEKNDD